MSDEQSNRAVFETKSGEKLIVRLLREGDGPALQAFHAGLSDRSRSWFNPHSYTLVRTDLTFSPTPLTL